MTNKIVGATIQARMSSERFPGKVLKLIKNKPMLLWQVKRLFKVKSIDKIVIATSNNPADDEIVHFCKNNKIEYFRGSENNVIDRISRLLIEHKIDYHVEFYGDSPFIDSNLVDEYIQSFLKIQNKFDYLSNCIKTTFPPGLEIIIYKSKVLHEINNSLDEQDHLREHAGFNITRFPNKYKILSLNAPKEFYMPDLFLEVDTRDDFKLISYIFNYFFKIGNYDFDLSDILALIKKYPHLKEINNNVHRRWRKLRSE
tara:strand:- start:577 stop:1344 length:768 start_codon:yes stop_codon:yes gene_type:complete